MLKNDLTKAECAVAELVAEGMTNKQVGEKLFVCERTVKFHCTNIFRKMGVKNRKELIVMMKCRPDTPAEQAN